MRSFLLSAAVLVSVSVSAATFTWDPDVTAGLQDGAGTWDTSTPNWTTDGGASDVAYGNAVSDAVFIGSGGTGATITVGTVNANALTFGATVTSGYTLTGGTITLSGAAPTITNNNTAFGTTISSVLAGTAGLTFAGSGTTILSSANTYTGGTSLTGGTVKLGNASALGTGGVTVNVGSVLDWNGKTLANTLTLAGGVIDNSSTTTNLSLNGSKLIFAENTEIKGTGQSGYQFKWVTSTVDLGGKTLTQSTKVWANSGATITIKNGTYQLNSVLDGYGRMIWNSDSVISIGSGGSFNVGGVATLYNVSGTAGSLNLGGATTINQTGTRTLASVIGGGANALTFAGTGTTTLSGNNTYSGGTTITGGTIKLGHAAGLGTGAVSVGTGTVLDFAGFAAGNSFTLAGGELQNSASASELDIPAGAKLALTANSTLGAVNGGWWKYNGTYNLGGFTLTQTGQSWTPGTTTISNGTIQLNARWDGYGRVTWASDSALSIGTGGTYNVGGATTLYNVSGTAGSLNLGGATTINQTGTRTLASAIGGGANAVTFAGTGTTTLTGTNNYSGGTSITGGTIVTESTSALGTGAVTLGGGTLQIGATNLSGIASLTVNTGTLNTAGGTVTTTGAFALAGGTWVIGDTADAIMAGSFTLTGGVIDLTGFTNKSTAGTYSLISGTGTSSFTNANFTNGDAGFSYAIDGNGDLTVTAVPEPSTYGLLGAGALAAAAFVRRRRKAKVA